MGACCDRDGKFIGRMLGFVVSHDEAVTRNEAL